MGSDFATTQASALKAAHDRIRRKKERLAAEAHAKALAAGITPSSTNPSLPPSTSLSSFTFSESSSTSALQYPQPSSSGLQLSLPGPLTPLRSIYPGSRNDTPPLPGQAALGLTTSVSGGSVASSGFGLANLQPSGSSTRPLRMTALERRRAKEAAGEAMGLEDEIDWAYEEETLLDPSDVPLPIPEAEKEYTREEVLAMREERLRKEEMALRLAGAQNLARTESRRSGSDGSSYHQPMPEEAAAMGKKSRWNPHAHGTRDEAEGSGSAFQVLQPESGGYKNIGIDAQYKKEKKREERKELVGRLFGKKGKAKEEGRSREAWEEKLEELSRAETGSRERSLNPSASLLNASKSSLPSSSSQPIRGILKQPGQPSRRMQPSFTAPSLSSLAADPSQRSPATHTTDISSNSGLPHSSQIRTPYGDAVPLPDPNLPAPSLPTKGNRPDTAGTITASNSRAGPEGWEALARPFGQAMANEANMDRRPSLASSTGASIDHLPGGNDTQTSLVSATSSSGLFYGGAAPALAPPLSLPTGSKSGQEESSGSAVSGPRKKQGIISALFDTSGRSKNAAPPARAFPLLPAEPVPRDASPRPPASPFLAAEPYSFGRNQDSRYPEITAASLGMPTSFSYPDYSHLIIQGFNNARRPSDTTVTYNPSTPRADPVTRTVRRRSASMTQVSPVSRQIAHPSTFYVPHRRERTGDSDLTIADEAAAVAARAQAGSPDSAVSLDPITMESIGVPHASGARPRRMSRTIAVPIYGIPQAGSASTSYIPLPPRHRQQFTVPNPQPTSEPEPASNPQSQPLPISKSSTPGFFARNASAINLALQSGQRKVPEAVHEHFESIDPLYPTVAFRMENDGWEKHMETYFPPSKSSSRDLLHAILPEAPTTLGRIDAVKKLQATVWIRLHPKPAEGKGGRSRPGTAGSFVPAFRSMMGGSSRPGTAVSMAPTIVPLPGDDEEELGHRYPPQWKKMILVLTSFSFDGADRRPSKAKAHTRESTVGVERTVAHLHLFEASPAMSPTKRPKTNETFGPRPFGGALGGYQPESEKIEVDRRALKMPSSMVVLGDILDLGRRAGESDAETRDERFEKRTRHGVLWFSWGTPEGCFVQFQDKAETDAWLAMTRQILRCMGMEDLHQSIEAPYGILAVFDQSRAQQSAEIARLKELRLSPDEHIAKHLKLGFSIWDPQTNPLPRTPRGTHAPPADIDKSPTGRWARYEHPAIRPLREKDKLETFDTLAFGRVGWREWLWPVPPGREAKGSAKAEKRAEGKRRRRRKLRAKLAQKNKGKGKAGDSLTTPRPRRNSRRQAVAESPEGTDLPLLLSDAIQLERRLEATPAGPAARTTRAPGTIPYANSPPLHSPLRPLLLSADSSKSIVSSRLPRQGSSRSIAPSVISTRSGMSAFSTGSDSTARSGATFGRPPPSAPTSVRPSPPPAAGNRPPSSAGGPRSRPGTANRNLPPPSMPPPSTPLPLPPTTLLPPAPLQSKLTSSSSSASSYSSSGEPGGQEQTPKAATLGMFPQPPATRPASSGGPASAFGSGSSRPQRRTTSSTGPSAYSQPAQRGSTPPPLARDDDSSLASVPRSPSASSLLAYKMPESSRPSALAPGEWYGHHPAASSAAASSASLVSDGSGGLASAAGSIVSMCAGPSARRRRLMAPAIDLAGEINAIDAARDAEIRAEAAAAAAAEEPIDENRPRVIRFA